MSKIKMTGFMKTIQTTLTKHSPEILTGMGIAGMIGATVLAVKATPKALRLMEAKKEETEVEQLTPVETIKTTWKCYIPAAVTGTVSIACLVGASSVNARRNTALAAAYKLSETALTEYKEKVIETVGEKKEKAVRDAVARDKIKNNPVEKREVIITGRGKTLCYDPYSDRYFESDIEKLRKAANDLNLRMFNDMYVTLNEYYSEIGLREIALGHELGWNINNGGKIELYFSPQLTADEEPCVCVEFEIPPKYGYQ